ncbi:MAG: formylglycine-generating enzyme family protein [Opitutus sp.]
MSLSWFSAQPSTAEEGVRAPSAGHPFTVPGPNLTLLWVADGTFRMGSMEDEPDRKSDESPITRVTLSRGFWLGRFEVTQGQWAAVMGTTPAFFQGDPLLPVEQVSWDDAVAFCQRLTEKSRSDGTLPDGYVYQLPTEAQWEYACRAGSREGVRRIDLPDIAWFRENTRARSERVGQLQPNAWGFHDMLGNVWEWCADYNGPYPGGVVVDPPQSEYTGLHRVVRGGSFTSRIEVLRPATRGGDDPETRNFILGFRLALAPVRTRGAPGP